MERLFKEATKSTPKVDFNPALHRLLIKGESYPENSIEFYAPLFDWLEEYLAKFDKEELAVEIQMSYMNTSSTKSIMRILNMLEEAYQEGKQISINWYYDSENELSYEIGEDFKDYLKLPLSLLAKE